MIRTYPDEWPDFITSCIETENYEQFQFFLEEMKTTPSSILSPERKTAITNELVEQSANFLSNVRPCTQPLCLLHQMG